MAVETVTDSVPGYKFELGRAAALREGKLGVMDYYQMKNVEADTNMRDSIAKVSAPPVNSEGKK